MKIDQVEKLIANFSDKKEYVMRIRNVKKALNHGLELKKCIESLCQSKSLAKAIHWYEYRTKTKSKI